MNFIASQGVKHIFLLPGGGAMHLVDSLGCCKELTYITLLHEQACAIAAEAYARVTNNLGVLLVTTGPGGTNAITGIAGAWLESTPCLVLSGQVKRSDMKKDSGVRQLGPQEVDIISMVQSITKYAVTVDEPNTIRYHLEKAVYLATHGRPGPVWLDIPLDVQAVSIDSENLFSYEPSVPYELSNSPQAFAYVNEAINLLNQAKRPVLLAGQGVQRSGAINKFIPFVDTLGIPVLTTWAAAELIPYDHELNFGRPGMIASRGSNFILQNADCLLTIGARLDASVIGFDHTNFARAARKIIVDIDQNEINKVKTKVDVRACVDAGLFIDEILDKQDQLIHNNYSEWIKRCRDWINRYPIVLPEHRETNKFVDMYYFTEILAEELDTGDLIIPGSSGTAIDIFWLVFEVKQNQRLISTGGLGAMGFGIPASIGSCIASENKRTISVDGDGGFQLNVQELAIVANRALPIKYFILNNQGYGSIRNMQRSHFGGNLVASDATSGLFLPDLIKVASAYGLATFQITNHEGMRDIIRQVIHSDGPVLCNVMIKPEQKVMPRVASEICKDGSIKSKPLEDLWPFLDRSEFLSNMIISK
jgi:acetolactate synthase-1/2/3 large subunit